MVIPSIKSFKKKTMSGHYELWATFRFTHNVYDVSFYPCLTLGDKNDTSYAFCVKRNAALDRKINTLRLIGDEPKNPSYWPFSFLLLMVPRYLTYLYYSNKENQNCTIHLKKYNFITFNKNNKLFIKLKEYFCT